MNTANESSSPLPLSNGEHLATISHDGSFWEVYLEFQDDPGLSSSYRGLLCFLPATAEAGSAWRTTTILIESSYEEVVSKARAFEEFQLQGLLRSVLPESE
jgi:hypothetical protein|tara:strand:+ start:116 stop:418 length:303 start_codon:yes stop_codon:yes gene_type:complete